MGSADFAVAGGIGAGLSSFADSYLRAKQMQESNDRNQQYVDLAKQRENAGLLAQGMQASASNPTQVEYNPETLAIKEQQKQKSKDELDPNSEVSKRGYEIRRQTMNQLSPGAGDKMVPQGASEADLKAYDQFYEKSIPGFSAKIKAQSNEDIQSERNQLAIEKARAGQGAKENKDDTRRFTEMDNGLNPNRGRAGNLAKIQEGIYRAERLDALTATSNNLDSRQQEEYAIGLQALLSSGHPAAEQVKNLVPHTAMGNTMKLKEWLFNSPYGLNNQDFVNRMKETVSREKDIMRSQLKDAQYANLANYEDLKEKNPTKYQNILNGRNLDLDEHEYFKKNRSSKGYKKEAQSNDSGTIKMQDPQGNIRMVPVSQKDAAIKAGGKVVE